MEHRAPTQTLHMNFSELSYHVRGKDGKRKEVLKQVSGRFQPGRLAAVLGPSGAGKTSLLNVLSGFKQSNVHGDILVNGEAWDMVRFRRESCYIPQEFAMLTNLTTQETMAVAATLKLREDITIQHKRQLVRDILELLGLQKTADTSVGRLSGGEKKRLSIGMELITNPPIMFFDEPTSGLDSSSSVLVMSHLKTLAMSGRTVVCVVHQPSSRLFQMFDDVLVLAEGQMLYCGPVQDIVPFFQEGGFTCPHYYNRADFALEVASYEHGDTLEALVDRCRLSQKSFVGHQIHTVDEGDLSSEHTLMLTSSQPNKEAVTISMAASYSYQLYPISYWHQFLILLQRTVLCNLRDLHLAKIRLITHLTVGLLLGCIYYDIGNEASKVASNAACIFFFMMFLFFSNAIPTVHSFPLEASVFLREHLNNWYSLGSYYFAKLLSDVPLLLLCPTTFLLVSYFLTGQPIDCIRVMKLWMVCMLLTALAQTLGLVAGAACDVQTGVFMVSALTIPMFLFSGFFMRLQDIPVYLQWLSCISYFRFGFEAAMIALYGFGRPALKCSVPFCHFKSPRKFLEEMDMTDDLSFWMDSLGLAIWIILLQVILYVILRWRLYKAQ